MEVKVDKMEFNIVASNICEITPNKHTFAGKWRQFSEEIANPQFLIDGTPYYKWTDIPAVTFFN